MVIEFEYAISGEVKIVFVIHRDEKEPLKETGEDAIKRNSSVEFDGRRVYATSGTIIGKNSAV